MSINNLDSSKVGSPSGTCVPSGSLHAIAGLKSIEIDLTGSGDGTREASVGSGESKRQLTSGVLGFVGEGDVKGEERVDVVVWGGGGDSASVLSSKGTVGLSLFDGDNQVGEQGCLSAWGGRGCGAGGGCGGDTFVDCDRGGVVWRRRRVDSNGDCAGVSGGGGRRWVDGDCAGGDEGFLGNADVVFADCFPWVTSCTVLVAAAAHWGRWGRDGVGGRGGSNNCGWWWGGRGDVVEFDAHVVDTDCGVWVAAVAVVVSHAAHWRRGRD